MRRAAVQRRHALILVSTRLWAQRGTRVGRWAYASVGYGHSRRRRSAVDGVIRAAVGFLIEWVSDGEAEARRYLADHAEPDGASLIATDGSDVIGYVVIVWESNYAGFRRRGIPLVHQIAVAGPFRRRGVATLLMDAAEQLARDQGIITLGITVGLFDEYGPAQRLYGRRGYIPDGRGACRGQGRSAKACRYHG